MLRTMDALTTAVSAREGLLAESREPRRSLWSAAVAGVSRLLGVKMG